MVKFLGNIINKFNNLILNYFLKQYNLTKHNLTKPKLNCINEHSIYVYKNTFIIHNKILNAQYHQSNCKLDESKYSLVCILYKNIHLSNTQNVCNLDIETKNKIHNIYEMYKESFMLDLSDNVVIIGRKYIYKNQNKINNTLSMFGIYKKKDKCNDSGIFKKNDKSNKINDKMCTIRRKFLLHLKNEYNGDDTSIYIQNLFKNSIFLDVEYVNDIYDDFEQFPISKDSTLLFMIGYVFKNDNFKNETLKYKYFIVDKLQLEYEYYILNEFLKDLNHRISTCTTRQIFIFHWSNADKSVIEKSLKRHPELEIRYNNMKSKIKYVDLLLLVKKTMFFKSYSLKYIAKELLNITYDTDCKNGFDAMCSIIQNNCILEKTNKINKLSDFESTNDIIKYNKLDTELLVKVLNIFTKLN